MARLTLRIGITGSAGTGKTTLAKALSEALGIPVIGEEMREYLQAAGIDVSALGRRPRAELRNLLEELWSGRRSRERVLESFVADNCALDFLAYALTYGIYDDVDDVSAAPLLIEPGRLIGSYDAIFVLPHGDLSYESDGVRAGHGVAELRSQYLIENALRRHAAPSRVHYLPAGLHDLEQRVKFVSQRLKSTAVSAEAPRREVTPNEGKVYLVGAGPGHPELLTVRATQVLAEAEVVAHDRLISEEMLRSVAPDAEWLAVGHRGRGARHVGYRLHPAALEAAQAGKRVVRLKAGDPLIFGRGGEEAEELSEHGIPFEIVPGISAAVGAAAYAGIPLTHRDHASDVTFATGHEAGSGRPTLTDWGALAKAKGTLVLYMAARRLEGSLQRLMELGRSAETPAAYIAAATQVNQKVLIGTLGTLAQLAQSEDRTAPGLVLVGDVIRAREGVDWLLQQRPLFHRRILVARARKQPSRLAKRLSVLGARVTELPTLGEVGLPERENFLNLIGETCDALVFDSESDVRFFLNVPQLPETARIALESGRMLALTGPAREALVEQGFPRGLSCPGSCLDALGPVLIKLNATTTGRNAWLPGPLGGRPNLKRSLDLLGWNPIDVPLYRRQRKWPQRGFGHFDAAVFPSSTAVRNVLAIPGLEGLVDVPAISMGAETTRTLEEAGMRFIQQAKADTLEDLVQETLHGLHPQEGSMS